MKRSSIDLEKLGAQPETGGSKMSGNLFAGTMPEPANLLIDAVVRFLATDYDPQKPDQVAIVESTTEVTAEVVERALRQHASGVGRGPISWGWFPRDAAAKHFAARGASKTAEVIASELGVEEGRVQCLILICNRPVFATLSADHLLALAAEGLPAAPTRHAPDQRKQNRAKADRRARAKGRG